MKQKIEQYLAEQAETWSPTTLKSEATRLQAVAGYLDGNPGRLWKFLKETKAEYSRVTYWARATAFWAWANPGQPNPYESYRETKLKRAFSVAYTRKASELTLEEAKRRIELGVLDSAVRAKCLELLNSGMRWAESHTLNQQGEVVGKGGRRRKVFVPPSGSPATYWQVRAALKAVGLTPHGLRKIFASEMVRRRANPFQLMKLMGWTNLNTAQSYISATDNDLESLVKG